ncbi:MAG: selenocysteine-specific translation elongation factor [Acidobacteria bacterium]|nr:selenocysteine-specific translation elongation factor [Acidobacteriota bacterium]
MKHLVVGTAGHIDHGKSTLVLALTGTDPDRLKEEKARGITIDLGFAHWEAPGLSIAFVDVPGHERFVKNMLAGAGGIDAVLLIIAADESVMPQTREHFEICRLLQVQAGIIVLTKADLVDAETLELARLEAQELAQGSFLEAAPIVPVSARTGQGLEVLRAAIAALGETAATRRASGPTRLPIDRVFSMKGFGTVVTGTLLSGHLAVDDELAVLPGDRTAKARGVQVHGTRTAGASAGQRVAVNLGGVDASEIVRGQSLVSPGAMAATRVIDARIELLASASPLRHGARIRFHQGTSEVMGRVALSSVIAEETDGPAAAVPSADVPAGRSAYVRIRLEAPVVVTRGDRFILRAYSPPGTIAGGVVLDPQPPRAGIRTPGGRDRFKALDPARSADARAATGQAVITLVEEGATAGLPVDALTRRLGLDAGTGLGITEALRASRAVRQIGSTLVSVPVLERVGAGLRSMIEAHHRAQPLSDGLPREEVRERLCAHAAPGVFDAVVEDLSHAGVIVARDRLALATHKVEVVGAEADARTRLAALYEASGLTPPDSQEASTRLGVPRATVDAMLALLVRQRTLVKVGTLVVHNATLVWLKDDVRQLKSAEPGQSATLDVASFKERYGVSRKFAIPLLEFLDRERITRRVGDTRVLI